MKKQLLLFLMTIFMSMGVETASAYDIAVANQDGVTIYYNYINNGTELAVTSSGSSDVKYSGTIVIPDEVTYDNKTYSVTSIGYNAFERCHGLTTITISNSVTSIGERAFSGCSGLTSVTIPNSVTSIGDRAFESCTSLASVNIPNSVTSIGNSAFSGCSGLTSVTIPNSVTSIGDWAFSGCNNLTSVKVPVTDYSSFCNNKIVFLICDKIGKSVQLVDEGGVEITDYVIPDDVTAIGDYAFRNCSGLTSVTIPNSVTSIGFAAFSGCNIKKTIWLTNTPPEGYRNAAGAINYVANNQYGDLSNQMIYPYLSSMFEVDGVKYVPVNPSERICDAIDCVYDSTKVSVVIPSTVSFKGVEMDVLNVNPYICYGCSNLNTVTLGENIASIGNYAFYDCSSLQSIIVPNKVTKLGEYSFAGCKSIESFSVPKSVLSIGNNAFRSCTGIKDFIIENRDEELTLGSNDSSPLFADCPLDSVYIGGNISYPTSGNSGYSPFYRNATLRTVVITNKETEISANEFYGCSNLQNFSIGGGVTTFGDWAFSGCTSLKKLAFGSQLQTIGKEAFSDCNSITEITSKATVPPACGAQALDDINKWDCTLYVPQGAMGAYQNAEQWKDFFFVSEGEGSLDPIEPDKEKCATPTISYSNGKLTFYCATEGATCMSTITDTDITSYSGDEVQLNVTYNISVYAAKNGYDDSETATATLCWVDVDPQSEGLINDVTKVRANPVLIQNDGAMLHVRGAADSTQISVYSINGMKAGEAVSQDGFASINTNLRPGDVAIVKIGTKAIRVLMKR